VTKRKGKGGAVLGRRVRGWANWAGARAREKEEGLRPARLRAERGERERERKGLSLFFFKFLSNSFFKHSNSKQEKTMHSNHDAQTLIISKLF
jgi:hypothetical protein